MWRLQIAEVSGADGKQQLPANVRERGSSVGGTSVTLGNDDLIAAERQA
jgi:hypothetical protein